MSETSSVHPYYSAMLSSFALLVLAALPSHVLGVRRFEIVNNCPLPVDVYMNSNNEGTLSATGGSMVRNLRDAWSGHIYSDFNLGSWDGTGTVRAGFYGPGNYYYIAHDPSWLNVGVSIVPLNRTPQNGFCSTRTCLVNDCPNSFTSPPFSFPPPSTTTPPPTPLYACGPDDTGYRVTFCPDGTIPNYQPGPREIHTIRSNNKCVDVRGGTLANGTPIQIYDCNGTGAQRWEIRRGSGQQVKLSGTNFCIDAGTTPGDGVGMKIWECFPDIAAQQWIYTAENSIRLAGTNFCLDLTAGLLTNGNQLQTWTCAGPPNLNLSQLWT
ncbi:hypothetical protein FA15DRAFT_622740, partial [Coprinopsis marcescibilis]